MNERERRRQEFDALLANMNANVGNFQCPHCQTLGRELIDVMKISFAKDEKIKELTKALELAIKLLRDKEPNPVILSPENR